MYRLNSLLSGKRKLLDYENPFLLPDRRAQDLLSRMTLEEKVGMLAGVDNWFSRGNTRLGIPKLRMTDGPMGVRHGRKATAFPSGISLASTWNPEAVRQICRAIAREAKASGFNVLLGPCVCIHRVPQGGRNFESFSEDPYLASRIAVAYVNGVQDEGIIATTKHYACNNQEYERLFIDTLVDERTLHEIYLPAFKAAVQEAGTWSIMSAYNKVNGQYCSENTYLLNHILKDTWKFRGFVMSDWGAVHSTIETARAGLDIEMPSGRFLTVDTLSDAVKNGAVREEVINDKVYRMLFTMFSMGIFDSKELVERPLDIEGSRKVAVKVARESIILLKNEGNVLPLDKNSIKTVALLGPNADVARVGGGGSSEVDPVAPVSPLEGIRKKLGDAANIIHIQGRFFEWDDKADIESSCLIPPAETGEKNGLLGEYFDNMELKGQPVLRRVDWQINFDWGLGSPAPEIPVDHFSVRWTGKLAPKKSGNYLISHFSDDGMRVYLDNELVIDEWYIQTACMKPKRIVLEAGRQYNIKIEYFANAPSAVAKLKWKYLDEKKDYSREIDAARKADVVIFCAGSSKLFESESHDRLTLDLPDDQDELIDIISKINKNTIIVLNEGSPSLIEKFVDKVSAIIEAWYPGQECGDVIADVLFGAVNPSGKLPVTYLKSWEDSSAYRKYPGENKTVRYSEGILVGYRHFDKKNIEPLFPFGFGLSYTKFSYSNLSIRPDKMRKDGRIQVTCDIQNVGKRSGAEVAQLYVSDAQSSVERPPKELKGFKKVLLEPGEKKQVCFEIDITTLSFFDPSLKDWNSEPGVFKALVGSSSRDIKLEGAFELF